jgi:hypothetical protein
MAFSNISRFALEILNQNYRAPGISPGSMPPARGDAATADDPTFPSVDELLRVVAFVNADPGGRPLARQYQVRPTLAITEPPFTARSGGTPWVPGAATAFGQDLSLAGARFKKVGVVVRTDDLMVSDDNADMLDAQINLAKVGLVRALSEAFWHSVPATDDNSELAGLPYFLGPSSPQDVAYDTNRRMLGGLAELEARCSPSDGDLGAGPDVFVMSTRARWRLVKEIEDRGNTPTYEWSPLTQKRQLHYHGIPVLLGRVPEPAGGTTEAWALRLFGSSGVQVLHIGGSSVEYGLRVEPRTTVTGLGANGEALSATSGVEVFGVYSVLVPEATSIARLRGIPVGDPFSQP